MNIRIITSPITRSEALEIGQEFYTEMVKGVVDINKKIIALGGEYHMDANVVLIEKGCSQGDIWGFNIYPNRSHDDWIEYTSLINIRPTAHNRTMTVQDKNICEAMKKIIEELII
jgi:shikimate kinase